MGSDPAFARRKRRARVAQKGRRTSSANMLVREDRLDWPYEMRRQYQRASRVSIQSLPFFEMRKIDWSAPWGVPGATALVSVWFQECDVPVLLSLEVPAKSFVLRRWSNIYFSRPHKLFRRALFADCQRGFRLKPWPDTKHDVPRLIR